MLYLHIGRGKSGSTTIQDFARSHAAFLADQGIATPERVHPTGNHVGLMEALGDPAADQAPLTELVAQLEANATRGVFASSEFLINLEADAVGRLREALAGHPVRIICYVREYPGWIVSRYSQAVKKGRTRATFDRYFQRNKGILSVMPEISLWADAFGWDSLYVRTLDRTLLKGGDLVQDLCDVLGIAATPPSIEARNTSPVWWALEFLREFHAAMGEGAKRSGLARDRTRLLTILDRTAARSGEDAKVQYLTPQQWRTAADVFNSDAATLSEKMGVTIPPLTGSIPPRPFLPTLARLQKRTRVNVARDILRADRRQSFSPDVMAAVKRIEPIDFWERVRLDPAGSKETAPTARGVAK